MHNFFEFFIERLLWLWKPIYSLYKIISDLIAEKEKE